MHLKQYVVFSVFVNFAAMPNDVCGVMNRFTTVFAHIFLLTYVADFLFIPHAPSSCMPLYPLLLWTNAVYHILGHFIIHFAKHSK